MKPFICTVTHSTHLVCCQVYSEISDCERFEIGTPSLQRTQLEIPIFPSYNSNTFEPPKEDSILIKGKLKDYPKVSFIRRFHCMSLPNISAPFVSRHVAEPVYVRVRIFLLYFSKQPIRMCVCEPRTTCLQRLLLFAL